MGIIITNKFYTDCGMQYCFKRLQEEFLSRGKPLTISSDYYCSYLQNGYVKGLDTDFVIFWDKDISLARAIEALGIKVYPSLYALEICDDKEKTYSALAGQGINLIDTMIYPLTYDVNDQIDERFLSLAEQVLGYPIIVKENVGSQGRQVYIAENRNQLRQLAESLKHIPHQYQRFLGEYGSDIRLYTVGSNVVASVKRTNTTSFRSNIACGGHMEQIKVSEEYIEAAIKIASLLKMDFGSVDFLCSDKPVFLEANSNAYFKGIENLGISVADKIAEYILERI